MKKIILYVIILEICVGMSGKAIDCSVAQDSLKNKSPLWELGLFNGVARIPHYPGADEYSTYILPLPYFIYRGQFIQSDREGVRGIFINTPHIETSLSFSGNPPVSGDNDARDGMPDLGAILEVGPALKWFFMGRYPLDTLCLKTALRFASAADFDSGMDLRYQGIRGSVNLIYQNRSLFEQKGFSFGFNAGANFADSNLNSYFYNVSEEHARSDRGFFESDGGYTGFSAAASAQKKITRSISLASYFRWDNIAGTAFEDSPLVKENNNFVIGCALIWKIMESEK